MSENDANPGGLEFRVAKDSLTTTGGFCAPIYLDLLPAFSSEEPERLDIRRSWYSRVRMKYAQVRERAVAAWRILAHGDVE